MSSVKPRRGVSPVGETIVLWAGIGLVALILLGTWVPTHVAAALDGTPGRAGHAGPPGNPFRLAFGLTDGTVAWTHTATTVLAALVIAVLVTLAAAAGPVLRRLRGRKRVDRAASRMGGGRSIAGLREREVRRTADRLGVQLGKGSAPGLEVARTVRGGGRAGLPLFQDWEAVSVDVWGPRAGKSSSRAIPAIMAAPGAVVATSNKRDLVDATRDPRAAAGEPVWVFDPQGLVDEPVDWWWNPLSYVTDETRARTLADVFANAVRNPGARTDAYFDAAALDLLASLLLAAAAAGRDLTQVYLWLTDPNDDGPATLLETAGYPLPAAAVRGVVGSPDKQRAGVYGTAQQVASFMTNAAAMRWVTPHGGADANWGSGGGVPRGFRPDEFVRTAGTLYSLSREGRGNAAPLVTALTVAVCEAAEDYAATQPHGRLPTPMVAVLDEAANVCRWSELPNLYSHYGSRGIALLTFLQSWSQGVDAWGREGMRKLWSAANVKVYGGGVSEVEFLDELSRLIGDHDRHDSSVTYNSHGTGGGGGRSTSHQVRPERILDVADLAALDRGRVVVLAAGSVPVLAQTRPWWQGPDRAVIAASIAAHDPGPGSTNTLTTQQRGATIP